VSRRPLGKAFYRQEPVAAARALLGCVIRRIVTAPSTARIVETEAYLGANDPRAASPRPRSARNESMYLDGATRTFTSPTAYYCMNVVTGESDIAEAVLLRAAQRGDRAIRANRPGAARARSALGPDGCAWTRGRPKARRRVARREQLAILRATSTSPGRRHRDLPARRRGRATRRLAAPLLFAGNRYVSMPRSARIARARAEAPRRLGKSSAAK
jgi:hypothetical protein